MKYTAFAIALGFSLGICSPAEAAVDLGGGFTIDDSSFGTGKGVHSTGEQEGKIVTGVVNQDGSGVTFTSDDVLSINGQGQAVIDGVDGISNLLVEFESAWDLITFSFDSDVDSAFELTINGLYIGNCSICQITDNGQNKFTVSGSSITSLGFAFNPAIATARQFRVEGVSNAVPEPTTWALMLFGFGAVGFGMRRRRRVAEGQVRVRFAV